MNYIKPMLCKTGDEAMLGKSGMILQRKYDGTRVIVYKDGDDIHMIGRSQKNDFALMYPSIVTQIRDLPWDICILDAELTFFKKGTDQDVFVTALATEETKQQYDVKLVIFDILATKEMPNLMFSPLYKRLTYLDSEMNGDNGYDSGADSIIVAQRSHVAHTHKRVYMEIIGAGGEGVVLKDHNSTYQPGKRTGWFKIKKIETADCVVLGVTKGTGERESTFGALILGMYDGNGNISVIGNASGFTREVGMQIWTWIQNAPEMDVSGEIYEISMGDVIKLVKPTRVCEVAFMEWTDNKKMRFPRFIRFRDDKKACECLLS